MRNKTECLLFSPAESRLLKILGKKKMTITELSEIVYRDEKKKPMNASIIVSGLVHRINKKAEFYDLAWFINAKGRGRLGKTIWLDVSA